MAHIHTKPGQHDLTASAFIIRTDTPEPTIMFHMHEKIKKYMFFGGHVELNENPWQCIEHELIEESGYTLSELNILQPKLWIKRLTGVVSHPSPVYVLTTRYKEDSDHFHTDMAYAFVANKPPKKAPLEGEVSDFKLFTREDILALPREQIFDNLRESALHTLDSVFTGWHEVPATEMQVTP